MNKPFRDVQICVFVHGRLGRGLFCSSLLVKCTEERDEESRLAGILIRDEADPATCRIVSFEHRDDAIRGAPFGEDTEAARLAETDEASAHDLEPPFGGRRAPLGAGNFVVAEHGASLRLCAGSVETTSTVSPRSLSRSARLLSAGR